MSAFKPKGSARKRCLIWGLIVVAVLSLGGLTAKQFFVTRVVETSYNSTPDIWSDPRDPCEPVSNGWQCHQNPHMSPTATMQFYAGHCDGTNEDLETVALDLPVAQLTKIDANPQVKNGGLDSIVVTYRPSIFGIFGSSQVLKVEAAAPNDNPCGPDAGW